MEEEKTVFIITKTPEQIRKENKRDYDKDYYERNKERRREWGRNYYRIKKGLLVKN
jgi:hypothetical protein